MNSTYDFTLKKGTKSENANFLGTKGKRNFLEGIKRKVNIFVEFKNIFNPFLYKEGLLYYFLVSCFFIPELPRQV